MTPTLPAAPSGLICQALGRRLTALSEAPLFGLAGSGNLEFISAFQSAGGTYHGACHEAGAVAMADGWAQAAGAVGLATLHQGPGLTNGLTALVDSAKAGTPLLVVVGEVAPTGGHASQWIDQEATLGALGIEVDVHRLTADHDPEVLLAGLVESAARDRRPTVLLAPVDVQVQRCRRHGDGRPRAGTPYVARRVPDRSAILALAERLSRARRPVILAGRGALLARAGTRLEALGERLGALLATTAPAHGLFSGDPFAIGIAGGFASPPAARMFGESDVVLVAGASLSPWTTCEGRLFPRAVVERIDIDEHADGVTVAGDVALVTDALLEHLPVRAAGDHRWRSAELAAELAAYRRVDELPADGERAERIHPGVLWAELEKRLPDRRCVTLDSGHFMAWPAMLATAAEPGDFLFGQAFQAVGLGIARSIGAALARPDRLTMAVVGDGGAMMGLPEFDTAVRAGVPLLVVVFNDAGYGAEVHDFAPLGVPIDAALYPDRDFAAIARAMGGAAVTVHCAADLDAVGQWCAQPRGALLVDAKVDPRVDATSLMTPLGAAGWSLAPRTTEGPPR